MFPLSSYEVVLVDSSKKALEQSGWLFKGVEVKKSAIQANVAKFETNKRFDLVHSHGLIEHFSVNVRNELIAKHIKFTKKGGYIIIFAPTPTGSYLPLGHFCEFLGVWPFPDERPILKEELIIIVGSCKVRLVDCVTYYFLYPTVGILLQKV